MHYVYLENEEVLYSCEKIITELEVMLFLRL